MSGCDGVSRLFSSMNNNRGWVLSLVIVTAVIFAIAAYTALFMAVSRLRRSGSLTVRQVHARLAAQGGMAWAMQKLIDDPTWDSPAGNVDLTLNGMGVDIIIDPCANTPCPPRPLRVKVIY